ncbi:hypothetical protein [Paractinoplanes toevensis]|nr:hypothetical protein [Actinoplanes toevensis]
MICDPRLSLKHRIRRYLGTHLLPHLEDHMTTFVTLLNGLAAQQQEASAAQQASFVNLHNAIGRLDQSVRDLEQAVANGDASPEVEAKAAEISQALADMKSAADTADNGFEPVEEPPAEEPAQPEAPVEPGTETPAEGDRNI